MLIPCFKIRTLSQAFWKVVWTCQKPNTKKTLSMRVIEFIISNIHGWVLSRPQPEDSKGNTCA